MFNTGKTLDETLWRFAEAGAASNVSAEAFEQYKKDRAAIVAIFNRVVSVYFDSETTLEPWQPRGRFGSKRDQYMELAGTTAEGFTIRIELDAACGEITGNVYAPADNGSEIESKFLSYTNEKGQLLSVALLDFTRAIEELVGSPWARPVAVINGLFAAINSPSALGGEA